MKRRTWLSAAFLSLLGIFGLKPKTTAQEITKPFVRFKLKVTNRFDGQMYGWSYNFETIEDLLVGIDKNVKKCNERGGYVTFSQTGECIPADDGETVLTIYYCQILCPRSAGGRWAAWDDYNKPGWKEKWL